MQGAAAAARRACGSTPPSGSSALPRAAARPRTPNPPGRPLTLPATPLNPNPQGIATVAAVDCKAEGAALCQHHAVRSFPTLKLFGSELTTNPYTGKPMKELMDYEGKSWHRDIPAMPSWAAVPRCILPSG
jgi:hypothetical protein